MIKKIIRFLEKYEIYITLIVLLISINYFSSYGFLFIIGIYVVLTLWKLFGTKQGRDYYKMMITQVQMQIWKKPLQKEYWKKDEFKNTKLKWVWWSKKNVKTDKK